MKGKRSGSKGFYEYRSEWFDMGEPVRGMKIVEDTLLVQLDTADVYIDKGANVLHLNMLHRIINFICKIFGVSPIYKEARWVVKSKLY